MLIAWDKDGNIIATLSFLVARDALDGDPVGLVDFVNHEKSGGRFRHDPTDRPNGVWNVPGAVGSGSWPEYLGARAHEFKVETDNRHSNPVRRLVHKDSKVVRDRDKIDRAIDKRVKDSDGPADIRDLVGGPMDPLVINDAGQDSKPVRAPHLSGVAVSVTRKVKKE